MPRKHSALVLVILVLAPAANGQFYCEESAINEIGECGCDSQLFINEDCTRSFFCTTNIPDYEEGEAYDPSLNNGCALECPEGQVVVFAALGEDSVWDCIDAREDFTCPGRFQFTCPEEPTLLEDEECECPLQTLVNSDCSGYRTCGTLGTTETCDPGQVVGFSFLDMVSCQDEEENSCPFEGSLGGYKIGCDGACAVGNTNPYAECECEDQFHYTDDCRGFFYCSSLHEGDSPGDSDGCEWQCPEGEHLVPGSGLTFLCEPDNDDFVCNGGFVKTCPSEEDEFKVSCNCAGEIWVDSACSQGFVCSGPAAQDGTNPGSAVECSPGSKISVTYFGNSVDSHGDISCQEDDGSFCIGPYHMGTCTEGGGTVGGDDDDDGAAPEVKEISIGMLFFTAAIQIIYIL